MWGQMFMAFFRVGMLGFGGGPSSIPLMHKEVVEKYRWMSNEDFSDILAIGNTLPGPILTKMAGYIGYRLKGIAGLALAVGATTLPTIAGMIVLLEILGSLKGGPRVHGMTMAVQPVVGVMLAVMAYEFFHLSWKKSGKWKSLIIGALSLIALKWFHLHPAVLIAVLLIYGFSAVEKSHVSQHDKKMEGSA